MTIRHMNIARAFGPWFLLLAALMVVALSCKDSEGPPAAAQSAKRTIGPEGGTVALAGTGVTLNIPAGALEQPVEISLRTTDAPSATDLGAPSAGPAILAEPEGLQFRVPVRLTLPLTTAKDRVRVLTASAGSRAFTALPSTVAPEKREVSAETLHFSVFVAAEELPGDDGGALDGGAPPTDAGTDALDLGPPLTGSGCEAGTMCTTTTLVGAGALNRFYIDKNEKLYVGNDAGYLTNASGAWAPESLNAHAWAIDRDGVAHTLSGATHSVRNGAAWTNDPIPFTNAALGCDDFGAPARGELALADDGAVHVAWAHSCTLQYNAMVHAVRTGSSWTVGSLLQVDMSSSLGPFIAVDGAGAWRIGYGDGLRRPAALPAGGTLTAPNSEASNGPRVGTRGGATYFAYSLFYATQSGLIESGVFVSNGALQSPIGCVTNENERSVQAAFAKAAPSVVADAAGKGHVAWVAADGTGAYYATNRWGSWVTVHLHPTAAAAEVAVGPSGKVYFALQVGGSLYVVTRC